jgi:hypothetical protein
MPRCAVARGAGGIFSSVVNKRQKKKQVSVKIHRSDMQAWRECTVCSPRSHHPAIFRPVDCPAEGGGAETVVAEGAHGCTAQGAGGEAAAARRRGPATGTRQPRRLARRARCLLALSSTPPFLHARLWSMFCIDTACSDTASPASDNLDAPRGVSYAGKGGSRGAPPSGTDAGEEVPPAEVASEQLSSQDVPAGSQPADPPPPM